MRLLRTRRCYLALGCPGLAAHVHMRLQTRCCTSTLASAAVVLVAAVVVAAHKQHMLGQASPGAAMVVSPAGSLRLTTQLTARRIAFALSALLIPSRPVFPRLESCRAQYPG